MLNDYNVVNGTFYHPDTPVKVIDWLETSRERKQRIRLFFGDTETGRDWMEESYVLGHIARSTGPVKAPLLIGRSSSLGGPGITDHCIIRIMTQGTDGTWMDVYRHPQYHHKQLKVLDCPGSPDGLEADVWADKKEIVARFKTRKQAARWIDFMTGERMTK